MLRNMRLNPEFALSDEEPEYPVSELNSHGPAVQGWRCKADSSLSPKEIILRFDKPAVVCRIQVLAHQYMIREYNVQQQQLSTELKLDNFTAERIELWIHYSSKGAATTPSGQTYEYLGFIALSDNTSTGCKSRELQSVPVGPKKGTHLKLRLGPAHKNETNKYDQVRMVGSSEVKVTILIHLLFRRSH